MFLKETSLLDNKTELPGEFFECVLELFGAPFTDYVYDVIGVVYECL